MIEPAKEDQRSPAVLNPAGARGWLLSSWRGEASPSRPGFPTAPKVSRSYLGLSLGVVVLAVVLLELVYGTWPVPPGVDSGDWIQRSFAWVGLAHPPEDAVGSPYLYNPLMFPLLGFTILAAGNPLAAGFDFGGLLLAAFGLSVVHLSRRFFQTGPFQLLFVGLAILNGTTISILFWGGYPNFLAFVLFNEGLVFLFLFLRTRSLRDSLLFYGIASLLYLTHDLTFVLFLATLGVVTLFLLVQDRRWFGVILSRANLVGLTVLGTTVLGYSEITKFLRITPPGYFASNPAAYFIDNIGEVFRPLNSGPTFFPMGAGLTMTPAAAIGILAGVAALLVLLLLAVGRWRPRRTDMRHFLATAAVVAACAVPVAGYLAHVDTDYTRFVYFLPLPVSLLLVLVTEGLLGSTLRDAHVPEVSGPPVGRSRRWGRAGRRERYAVAAVVILLVLLVANVTVPTAVFNEKLDGGTDHDLGFLQAMNFLNANRGTGSVLTTSGAVRWVEALTDRGAFDIGPTWLLFESWQVVNAEESYWALNSLDALTNNAEVLSFSGFNTSALEQAPMYSAYIQGVQFPLLRVLPDSIDVDASSGGAYTWIPADGFPIPVLSVPGPRGISGAISYSTSLFDLEEVGTIDPFGGAWINFTVTPNSGDEVQALNFTLATPPAANSFLHAPLSTGTSWDGRELAWNDSGVLGQLPGAYPIQSWVTPTPLPAGNPVGPILNSPGALNSAEMSFSNPAPGVPFTVSLHLSTDGTGNPAVVLPSLMSTPAFLQAHEIRYLLVPNTAGFSTTATFYKYAFGYGVGFQNTEWTVLQA